MIPTNYKFYKALTAFPCVEQVWLFGSRARKDFQDRADIDLAVYCPKASNRDWLDILNVIDEADTLLEIDCVRLDELDDSSPLKESIITQGIKLYERV
jgi:predicted nucleotidyltransferase